MEKATATGTEQSDSVKVLEPSDPLTETGQSAQGVTREQSRPVTVSVQPDTTTGQVTADNVILTSEAGKEARQLRRRSRLKRPYKSAEWELRNVKPKQKKQGLNSQEAEETCEKQAKAMIDELEGKGALQTIIDEGCTECEKLPRDFGRGGK